MNLIRKVLRSLCCVLPILLAPALKAQVNTATIQGQISDLSDAVVPDAALTLRDVNSGATFSTTSGGDGHFTFNFVPIGDYTLLVSKQSFSTYRVNKIHLVAAQEIALPIHLKPQAAESSITVDSDAIVLDTRTSSQTATLSTQQLNELPTQNQSWSSLLELDAGTTIPPDRPGSTGTNFTGSVVNINGLPGSGYNLTVDGTNATSNPEFNSLSFYNGANIINTINTDAIAEVSTIQGIPPASVSDAMSGTINIITKRGSNQFHGSLFEINQTTAYNANNRFATSVPRVTFNMYGGSIGGPILRDKLTFFGSYAGLRNTSLALLNGTVPTPYLRSISPSVYYPLLDLYPAIPQPASATAQTAAYHGQGRRVQYDGNGVARFDYNLNDANHFYIRYIRSRPYLNAPAVIASNPQVTSGHMDNYNVSYVHTGSRWSEDTRFGFNQLLLNRVNGGYASDMPALTYGFATGGANVFLQNGYYITAEEGVAYVNGNHNFQFGGIYQRVNAGRVKLTTPTILYSSLSQYQNNTPSSLTIYLYQMPDGTPKFGFTSYQMGGYAQDSWHARSNLTLNLGVRYDYFTVPKEYLGRAYNRGVDPAHPELGPGFGPILPADSIYNGDFNNVQPRFGFAWNVHSGTVLRGGIGMLVANHPIYTGPVGIVSPSSTLPGGITLTQAQIAQAHLQYPIDASQYPQIFQSLQQQGILSSTEVSTGVAINPYNPDPYSIQRMVQLSQMFKSMVFSIAYVGNAGVNMEFYKNENQPDRVTGAQAVPGFGQFALFTVGDRSNYNALQTKVNGRFGKAFSFGADYSWSKALAYGDGDLLQQQAPQDNDNMQAEYGPTPYDLRNRFVSNFVWQLPLSRLTRTKGNGLRYLTDGWQLSGVFVAQSGVPVNITDASSRYASDRPDYGAGPVYISGYRDSATHQYLNNCVAATCPTGKSATTGAFIRVPISSVSGAQVRGGTWGRFAVRMPGNQNLNASIAKTTKIYDKVVFQLRIQAFNALNHSNYSGLVTTVNSSTFGQLNRATSRTVQIGGRLTF